MSERVLLLLLVLVGPCSFAQDTLPTDPAHRVHVEVSGLYDSDVLSNEFIGALYNGGMIDRALRGTVADDLRSSNRGGLVATADAWYAWRDTLRQRPWTWRLGLAHRTMLGIRFAPDAYRVAFFGNAAFENDIAELGPSAFTQLSYQRIAFGGGRPGVWHLQLGLVNGMRLDAADIPKADLYTANDGEFLEVDLQGRYWRTDTATAPGVAHQGLGLSLSGEWTFLRWGKGDRNKVTVTVDDLGFIAWNAQSLHHRSDQTVHYDGIHVDDILDLDGLVIGRQELQDTLGLSFEKAAFLRPLPGRVTLSAAWGPGVELKRYEAVVDWRYLPGYLPWACVVRRFRLMHPGFVPELQMSYGGFGSLRVGTGFTSTIGRHCMLRLQLPNLVGLVDRTASGQAVGLTAEFRW